MIAQIELKKRRLRHSVSHRLFDYAKGVVWAMIAVPSLVSISSLPVQAQSQVAQVAPRITAAVDDNSRITLKGTVSPFANARNDAGAASEDMRLSRVQLVLKRSPEQESTLQQLIQNLHTPGTASYHKWLTPAQFGQQFGPADQDIQTIESWLQSHNLQVGTLNPGKGTLEISGTVGQLQDAFHTSIHKYVVNGQSHYANAADPQIPAALAPVLGGFVSLNNFHPQRLSKTLGRATYSPQTHQAVPEWTVTDSSSPLGYDLVVAPQDFAVQYDLNPLYAAGTTGTGQSIAVINDSNINLNLVSNFRTLFGVSPATNLPQVIIDGNDPGIDGINNPDGPNYDSGEAYLDVEWTGAVAPGATIDLVIGADTELESGLILAAERAVYSDIAPVMSLSFGDCELDLGAANAGFNGLWEQAAAEGITVLVAAGDTGSASCDASDSPNVTDGTVAEDGLSVSGYASTPYNVAVGGTDFYYSSYQTPSAVAAQLGTYWNLTPTATPGASLKTPIPEQAWNDSQYGLDLFSELPTLVISGGGGGASNCGLPTTDAEGDVLTCAPYAKPAWQTGTGVPSDSARDLPDVSLFAADGLNNSFYPTCAADGDCASGATAVQLTGVGGTSASVQAMAGIMALVNQKYGPQGQADYVLYPLAAQYPSSFHDVTEGTNAMPCLEASANCPSGELAAPALYNLPSGFATTTGFDLATGLGSIDANQLVTNWTNVHFITSATTLSPSSTSFTHGTAVTINAGVTAPGGVPTGSVSLMTSSTSVSNQAETIIPLSNGSGSASVNYLPGGTYNIWGQYGGNGTYGSSTSPTTQITVAPEASSLALNVLTPGEDGPSVIAKGTTGIPYGTQLILDGDVFSTTYYNSCVVTASTAAACATPSAAATGAVTFSDSGKVLNVAVLNTEGDSEYSSGAYAIGSHSITASYAGDASYNSSNASAVTFTVVQGTPTVSVTSNLNPIAPGQTLVLTAIVEGNGPGTAPTGTVTFYNGASSIGTSSALVAGVDPSTGSTIGIGTISVPVSSTNSITITALYSGDSNYAKASSSGYALTVANLNAGLLPSTTTGASTSSATSPSAAVIVTATVTGQTGHPAPTGTIDFQSSGQDFGTLTLSPSTTGDTSTVSTSLDSEILLQGANVITLQYSGDANYSPSSVNLSISNPLSDFSMVAQTPTLSVAPGGSTTDTLNFTSVNGFSGSVALTCAGPKGMTCTLNPATVTVTTATATLHPQDRPAWSWAGGGAAVACVFLFGIPRRRRRWQHLLGLVLLVIATVGIGCGGGGSTVANNSGSTSSSGTGTTPTATGISSTVSINAPSTLAAGTYNVVITGTEGTAITHNVTIPVQVN